jgi:hypothetical protein
MSGACNAVLSQKQLKAAGIVRFDCLRHPGGGILMQIGVIVEEVYFNRIVY